MRSSAEEFATSGGFSDPMLPRPCRVEGVSRETHDTFTIRLESGDGSEQVEFAPGQFSMLYVSVLASCWFRSVATRRNRIAGCIPCGRSDRNAAAATQFRSAARVYLLPRHTVREHRPDRCKKTALTR